MQAVNVDTVRAGDGSALDPVTFWEIGNEPYLTPEGRPELHITPEDFVDRANDLIEAMRDVDPSIAIGLPLRSDMLGISPLDPLTQGFANKVLGGLTEQIGFVPATSGLPLVSSLATIENGRVRILLMNAPLLIRRKRIE